MYDSIAPTAPWSIYSAWQTRSCTTQSPLLWRAGRPRRWKCCWPLQGPPQLQRASLAFLGRPTLHGIKVSAISAQQKTTRRGHFSPKAPMDLAEALGSQRHNFSPSAQSGFLLPPHRHWTLHRSCILKFASWRSPPVRPCFSLYRSGNSGSVRWSHLLPKGHKTSWMVGSGFEPTNSSSGAQALDRFSKLLLSASWSWRQWVTEDARQPVSPQLTASWVNCLCSPS